MFQKFSCRNCIENQMNLLCTCVFLVHQLCVETKYSITFFSVKFFKSFQSIFSKHFSLAFFLKCIGWVRFSVLTFDLLIVKVQASLAVLQSEINRYSNLSSLKSVLSSIQASPCETKKLHRKSFFYLDIFLQLQHSWNWKRNFRRDLPSQSFLIRTWTNIFFSC